jgi:hypothetical protein
LPLIKVNRHAGLWFGLKIIALHYLRSGAEAGNLYEGGR